MAEAQHRAYDGIADNQTGKTVIIADDDRTIRNVLSRVLEISGYETITADSGEACLELAREHNVGAFLVDVYMPGIDGLTVCRSLRNDVRYRYVPILLMTAGGEAKHVDAAFESGADDFIVKPVNPTTLSARLRGQIERYDTLIEMEKLRENLNRYISRRTQKMVSEYTSTGVLPAPEESEVCVMFSDVRDFTQISEAVDPQQLFATLSDNLGMQVDCVARHGGYIDKFAGDGIMAVFDQEDGSQSACRCALEILRLTEEASDYQPEAMLKIGIGIHTGTALIGNVGSELHLDYSVIGKTVNLSARLCGSAAPMTAVVSADVVRRCGDVSALRFNARTEIAVRGVREPVEIYQLECNSKPASR